MVEIIMWNLKVDDKQKLKIWNEIKAGLNKYQVRR